MRWEALVEFTTKRVEVGSAILDAAHGHPLVSEGQDVVDNASREHGCVVVRAGAVAEGVAGMAGRVVEGDVAGPGHAPAPLVGLGWRALVLVGGAALLELVVALGAVGQDLVHADGEAIEAAGDRGQIEVERLDRTTVVLELASDDGHVVEHADDALLEQRPAGRQKSQPEQVLLGLAAGHGRHQGPGGASKGREHDISDH
ncbi:MAG: hypothetical protein KDK70_23065 [Myxococcales bacterium]|nr:hypothetical protein [Myxococcales bacterium]